MSRLNILNKIKKCTKFRYIISFILVITIVLGCNILAFASSNRSKDITGEISWVGDLEDNRPASVVVDLFQNGIKYKTQEVKAEDNWQYTFSNVPVSDNNGNIYEYSISENKVDGYLASYATGKKNGVELKFNEQTGSVNKVYGSVTIYYELDGKTYSLGTFEAKEVAGKTFEIPSNDFYLYWKGYFNLLKYYGMSIDYIVEKDVNSNIEAVESELPECEITTLEGSEYPETEHPYTSYKSYLWHYKGLGGSGYDIININNSYEYSGKINWVGDTVNLRPEKIKVSLLNNNNEIKELDINTLENNKYTFNNIPIYKDDSMDKISYYVKADVSDEYITVYDESDITNIYKYATINIDTHWGAKVAEYERNLSEIKYSLIQRVYEYDLDGKLTGNYTDEVVQEVLATKSNNWKATFENVLRCNEFGEYYQYFIDVNSDENIIDLQGKNIELPDNSNELNITAVVVRAGRDINGSKAWNGDAESDRPESITLTLYQNGEAYKTITTSANEDWRYNFGSVPETDEYGNKYTYYIKETPVDNYKSTYSANGNAVEITFSNQLSGTGINSGLAVYYKVGEAEQCVAVFNSLDEAAGQSVIVPSTEFYVVTTAIIEVPFTYEFVTISDNEVINNINIDYNANLESAVVKKLDGAAGNYMPVGEVSENFSNVHGYAVTTSSVTPSAGLMTVVNVRLSTFDITVNWVGDTEQDRPDTLDFSIFDSEGYDILYDPFTLSASNNWTGTAYCYYTPSSDIVITEIPLEGYTYSISGDADNGYIITYTKEIENTIISGTKVWVDDKESDRPDSIVVNLLQDGNIIDSKTVTASDNWKYTFEVPKFKDSNKTELYKYSVEEVAVDGYKTEYAKNGVEVFFAEEFSSGLTIDTVNLYYTVDGVSYIRTYNVEDLHGASIEIPSKEFYFLYDRTSLSDTDAELPIINILEKDVTLGEDTVAQVPNIPTVEKLATGGYCSESSKNISGVSAAAVWVYNHLYHYTFTGYGEYDIINIKNKPTYSYVDGINGKDSNDGLTPETSIKTLKQAYTNLSNGGTIYIVNKVTLTDNVVLTDKIYEDTDNKVEISDGSILIKRYVQPDANTDTDETNDLDGFNTISNIYHMIEIPSNCTVTINGARFDGHRYAVNEGDAQFLVSQDFRAEEGIIHNLGNLIIEYSVISNSSIYKGTANSTIAVRGAGILNEGTLIINDIDATLTESHDGGFIGNNKGILNINGGHFYSNNARSRGGVIFNYEGTVNINSGLFGGDTEEEGNTAYGYGGVICNDGGVLNIYDGAQFFRNKTKESYNYGGVLANCKFYSNTSSTCYIHGGEFKYNSSFNGGALYLSGSSYVYGGVITNNSSSSKGGGLYTSGSTLIDGNILIDSNTCGYGTSGGGISNHGTLTIKSGTISNNKGSYYGGGIETSGTLILDGGDIFGNTTDKYDGAGIHVDSGTFTMNGGNIYDNHALDDGGGGVSNDATFNLNGGNIYNNTATDGRGGGVNNGGTFNMYGGHIYGNKTVYNTISNVYGGGVYNGGTFNMYGGIIGGDTDAEKNYAPMYGGGIYNSSTAIINGDNAIIKGNKSGSSGGGIYNNSKLTIENGQIFNNTSNSGGGVYNYSVATINGGTIYGNTASNSGGGIYNYKNCTLNITGGSVSNNNSSYELYNYQGKVNMSGGIIESDTKTEVYHNGTYFYMKDSALVNGKIYLYDSSSYVTVNGELTTPGKVAELYISYVSDTSLGRRVAEVNYTNAEGNQVLASEVIDKFEFTNKTYCLRPGDFIDKSAIDIADTSIIISKLVKLSYDKNTEDSVTNIPDVHDTYWNELTNVSSLIPVRINHNFIDWSVDENHYTSGSEISINKDTVLTANWLEQILTIQFDANGGKTNSDSYIVENNKVYTLLDSYDITLKYNDDLTPDKIVNTSNIENIHTPTRDGYYFNGWKIQEDSNEIEFTGTGTYPWVQSSDGTWASNNKGVKSTTSKMESQPFTTTGGNLEFEWRSNGENNYDYLGYDIYNVTTGKYLSGKTSPTYSNGNNLANLRGAASTSFSKVTYNLSAGTYKVVFMYGKDGSTNSNEDQGFVRNAYCENAIASQKISNAPYIFESDLTLIADWVLDESDVNYTSEIPSDIIMIKQNDKNYAAREYTETFEKDANVSSISSGEDIGLIREKSEFIGWTLTPYNEYSDDIEYIDTDSNNKIIDIFPELENGSYTVTLYALYKTNKESQNFVYLSTYGSITTTDGRKITPSDSNDGLTPETPIASFKKAYELLANTKGGTIYIVGNTIIDKNMTLTSEYYADDSSRVDITDGNITIKRYSQPTVNTDDNTLNDLDGYNVSSYKGILIELMSGKVINIGDESTGITIDGHRDESINSDLRLSADGVVANSSLIYNSGAIATIRNTTLVNNNITTSTNTQGGAILNQYGTLTLDRCTVENNNAYIGGGGIYNYGTLYITGGTVSDNETNFFGGGLLNVGTTVIDNVRMTGNSARNGGAIHNDNSAKLTINGGEFSNNTSSNYGGAICNYNSLTMTGGNIHDNSGVYGNGVYNGGTMNISASVVINKDTGDDVYLSADYYGNMKFITVNGELSTDNIIQITPKVYTNGKTVVRTKYPTDGSTLASKVINKFILTPKAEYLLLAGDTCTDSILDTDIIISSPVNLVYNKNTSDNVSGLPEKQSIIAYKLGYKVSDIIPTRDDYNFMHWSLKSDNSGTAYEPDADIAITDNTNLYAIWSYIERYAYIDGINGDDYNDGLTPSTPIKTFKQAYTNLSKGGTIYVVNTVNIDTDITLDKSYYEDSTSKIDMPEGSDVTIKRYARPKEYESLQGFDVESNVNIMIHINTGYSLILEDITIDGHKEAMTTGEVREITETGVNAKYAMIFNEGTLLINNAQLLNNNNTSTYSDGLVKRNYNEGNGGAIFNSGDLTIQGGSISYNTAYSGGGAIFSDKLISIKGGLLSNNTAATGGALYVWDYTDAELTGGVFQDNIARGDAGGIYLSKGTFTVENIKVSGNTARNLGGGFGIGKYTTLVMRNSEITNNKSSIGGGFCNSGTTASTLENVVITNNSSTSLGGGIAGSSSASITIGKGTVVSHNSSANGGGVYSGGEMLVDGAIISDNTATNGGGIYNDSSTTLLEVKGDTIINNNTAINQGGGIYNISKLTLTNNSIQNNKAVMGGGIYNSKTMVMNSGNITDNLATTDGTVKLIDADTQEEYLAAFGGAIYNSGKLTINDGTISRNKGNASTDTLVLKVYGGAIINTINAELYMNGGIVSENEVNASGTAKYNSNGAGVYNSGKMYMSGGTISHNIAKNEDASVSTGLGGGILNGLNGTLEITGGTVHDNEARSGAGLYNMSTVTMTAGNIINNKASSVGGGGGIWTSEEFNLEGGTISGNEAGTGAGIRNYSGGRFSISGGIISNNKANNGGAISNSGTLNITGGSITGNSAKNGGGIHNTGTINITSGIISDNSATSKGNGVYQDGTLYLEGNGAVDTSNDIYLPNSRFIYAKDLTDANISGIDIIAVLTPHSYTNGRTVVRTNYSSEDILASIVIDRFELTPNGRHTLRPGDYVLESANILDTDIIISELFDVKFNKNTSAEVTNMPEDFTVYWCEPASIEDKTPIREYSEFLGWCKIPNPDISTYAVWAEDPSAMFYPGDSLIVKSNIIFYAIWDVEELTLDAHIVKVLGDGAPIFKSGELGILVIDTVGFVEELEIDFPKELTKYDAELDKIIEVNNDGNIRTKSRFIVPLRATTGIYTVIITAYGKDGNSLTVERDLQVINSSILDGLRTTLR